MRPARVPTIHSRTWKIPIPGQRPKLDPRRLRDVRKLNLSTTVLLTFTVWEKPRARTDSLVLREAIKVGKI